MAPCGIERAVGSKAIACPRPDSGDQAVVESNDVWQFTVKALTPVTVMLLPQQAFENLIRQSPALSAHVEDYKRRTGDDASQPHRIKYKPLTR